MHYPYDLECLIPLHVRLDEEGDTHAVYQLPAPKQWRLLHYSTDLEECTKREEAVSQVRVCLSVSPEPRQPYALVVPFGPDGAEWISSSVVLSGVLTYAGVLTKLGFAPLLTRQ